MKLTRLELTAFRSGIGLDLSMDAPRVLIAGINNSGKTTVRESIKWALTGRCQGVDGKGSGVADLIPYGQAGVSVGVTVNGIGRVARTGAGLSVDGFTGSPTVQQQALYDKLQTSPAFLDAVLDTETFLTLHHAEAKALIMALLDVRVKMEGDDATYTLSELDEMYDAAFKDRAAAKKVAASKMLPPKPVDESQPTVEGVEKKLKELRGVLEGLVSQGGQTAGQRTQMQAELFGLTSRPFVADPQAETRLEQIADLEERLAIMEADDDGLGDALQSLQDETPAVGSQPTIRMLRSRQEALAQHVPSMGCVIDQSVPCDTGKAKFTARAKALKAEVAAREKAEAPVQQAAPVVSAQTKLRQELDGLKDAQYRYLQAQTADEVRLKRVTGLEARIQALPDTTEHDAAVQTLKERIGNGETLLKTVQAHWAAVQSYTAAETVLRAAQEDVLRLEGLCEVLGPNGVRVQALQQAVGRFETQVNAFTQVFGLTVGLSVDPWRVIVNERPVWTYSKSERYRIGVAIQLAIAALSGLSFAVIDELDMLTAANRSSVTAMLLSAPLEQILVIGSREPDQALPAMRGVLAYRLALDQGRSVVAERSAA